MMKVTVKIDKGIVVINSKDYFCNFIITVYSEDFYYFVSLNMIKLNKRVTRNNVLRVILSNLKFNEAYFSVIKKEVNYNSNSEEQYLIIKNNRNIIYIKKNPFEFEEEYDFDFKDKQDSDVLEWLLNLIDVMKLSYNYYLARNPEKYYKSKQLLYELTDLFEEWKKNF